MDATLALAIDNLSETIKLLTASLATHPTRGAALAADPKGREQVLAEHDEKWNDVKARFPAFKVTPKSCDAYARHLETFGREPRMEALVNFDRQFLKNKIYTRARLQVEFQLSEAKAQAYIAFLKWAGLCVWAGGGICTLRKE